MWQLPLPSVDICLSNKKLNQLNSKTDFSTCFREKKQIHNHTSYIYISYCTYKNTTRKKCVFWLPPYSGSNGSSSEIRSTPWSPTPVTLSGPSTTTPQVVLKLKKSDVCQMEVWKPGVTKQSQHLWLYEPKRLEMFWDVEKPGVLPISMIIPNSKNSRQSFGWGVNHHHSAPFFKAGHLPWLAPGSQPRIASGPRYQRWCTLDAPR